MENTSVIVCPFCGKSIPEESLFCEYCGKKRIKKRICVCGNELIEGELFCTNCGRKWEDAVHSAAQPEVEESPATAPVPTAFAAPKPVTEPAPAAVVTSAAPEPVTEPTTEVSATPVVPTPAQAPVLKATASPTIVNDPPLKTQEEPRKKISLVGKWKWIIVCVLLLAIIIGIRVCLCSECHSFLLSGPYCENCGHYKLLF